MKSKKIAESTTNRGEFNRAYKVCLEQKGKIRCSYCKYHDNENSTDKGYGGYNDKGITYPNWKLVSKNKKQWMKKPIKIIVDTNNWRKSEYTEILF